MVTDDEIALEAKKRYPYDDENDNRINKLSSKRRRFIEGAKWMRDLVLPQANVIKSVCEDDVNDYHDCKLPKGSCEVCSW